VFENLVKMGDLNLCKANYSQCLVDGAQTVVAGLLVRVLSAAGVK